MERFVAWPLHIPFLYPYGCQKIDNNGFTQRFYTTCVLSIGDVYESATENWFYIDYFLSVVDHECSRVGNRYRRADSAADPSLH